MPRVSIVIPVYNPGFFLREALESVHAQSFRDWELIAIDDGSREPLDWVTADFPRVEMVRQENRGSSVARNHGVMRATGEFIAFMDQDDVWRPNKLERQVAVMEKEGSIGVCYCDLELIDKDGHPMPSLGSRNHADSNVEYSVALDPDKPDPAGGLSPLHLSLLHFSRSFVVPSTVMIRRTCLADSGLLDPFIPFSGDYDLLIKLGARHKVARIPKVDVLYRKHGDNFSDQYQVGRGEVKALISRYEEYARAKGDVRLLKAARLLLDRPSSMYAAQAYDCARRALAEKNFGSFVRHLKNAFWFSPGFVGKSVVGWARKKGK